MPSETMTEWRRVSWDLNETGQQHPPVARVASPGRVTDERLRAQRLVRPPQ